MQNEHAKRSEKFVYKFHYAARTIRLERCPFEGSTEQCDHQQIAMTKCKENALVVCKLERT